MLARPDSRARECLDFEGTLHVKSRFLNLLKKQKKFRRESMGEVLKMEEANDGTAKQPIDHAELDLPRLPRASRVVSVRDAAEQMLTSIRTVLAHDAVVLQVVDAWEAECTERADAIEASGLSPQTYDAAVKRIQRALRSVPADLVESAQDAMEVSHGA